MNCDLLGSPATRYSRSPSCSVFVPLTQTISVFSRLGWLSVIIMCSRVSYCSFYLNLTGYVTLNTASYLEDAAVILTVHWIANTPVPIHYTVYLTVVVYLLIKDFGMISSVRLCCSVHLYLQLILLNLYSIKY
jgi:predicted membrane chloride channel (bestrophin family)